MTYFRLYILSILIYCTLSYECKTRIDCTFHGNCINARCQCDHGWKGSTCMTRTGNRDCGHGQYQNSSDSCVCNSGWKTAGFTDTINWLDGKCSQFSCENSKQCQELTGFTYAKCPVKHWDCYCGLHHAGYTTDYVKCMTGIYAFSFSSYYTYVDICKHYIWKIALILAAISIPFGTTRRECDHHRSWMAYIKRCIGIESTCDGSCVYDRRWKLRNDLALSLYWIKVGVWWYGFLTLIGLTFIFIWCVILWILAVVAAIAAIIAVVCGKCNDDSNDNNCSDGCCGDGCCICCTDNYGYVRYHNDVTIIYVGGPSPANSCVDCCECDGCCNCCNICKPLGWMIDSYPTLPRNLQGGILGYILGIHCSLPRVEKIQYPCMTEFLSLNWMHSTDLRHDERWRKAVKHHVNNTEDGYQIATNPISLGMERQHHQPVAPNMLPNTPHNMDQSLLVASRYVHGSTTVETIHYTIPSEIKIWNREHYSKNECWICNEGSSTWHLWKPCNHVFCESCSKDMLIRKMPCPLCRQIPDIVRSYHIGVVTPNINSR